MQTRALVEAQTEASQLLEMTTQFIEKNKGFLTEIELADTNNAMDDLKTLIKSGNKDQLHTGIERLNEISRPYAERLMDKAIGVAMKGKSI